MTEVLIADDHSVARVGLELLTISALGNDTIIQFANSSIEVLNKLGERTYDMLITDLAMPGNMSLSIVSAALAIQPDLKVIVITAGSEDYLVAHCLQQGAYAFVNKSLPDKTLKEVIKHVSIGKKYLSPEQKERLVDFIMTDKNGIKLFQQLSAREKEVARLLLKGTGILEIAGFLNVSSSTISTLKLRIFNKLKVNSVMELSRVAYESGIIKDNEILL
jgi:two-component system, NarL family, invasion response regulator UvrY